MKTICNGLVLLGLVSAATFAAMWIVGTGETWKRSGVGRNDTWCNCHSNVCHASCSNKVWVDEASIKTFKNELMEIGTACKIIFEEEAK